MLESSKHLFESIGINGQIYPRPKAFHQLLQGLDDASSFLLKFSFGLELRFCLLHRLLLVLSNQPRMERVHNGALLSTICSLWLLGPGGYHLIHRFIHIVLRVGGLNPFEKDELLSWNIVGMNITTFMTVNKNRTAGPQGIFRAWKLHLPWQVTSPFGFSFFAFK